MKIIRSTSQLRLWMKRVRPSGKPIVFVPTMGALHAGHISLILRARREAGPKGIVAISIFVNPTQFNQKSDLIRYPRTLASDTAICRKAGVDLLFVPSAQSIYPPDFSTWVEEASLSKPLCGRSRPGHFRGVCTVVAKLFNLIQPDIAIFGQKDAQQASIIQRMARDLDFPVRIIVAPTVREKDGLAMSSRNQRLSSTERRHAAALYTSLRMAQSAFRKGMKNSKNIKQIARRHLLKTSGLRLDYLELVNNLTLKPVTRASSGDFLAVAAWVGSARLIDNVKL